MLVEVAPSPSERNSRLVKVEVLAVILEKLREQQPDIPRRKDFSSLDLGMQLQSPSSARELRMNEKSKFGLTCKKETTRQMIE